MLHVWPACTTFGDEHFAPLAIAGLHHWYFVMSHRPLPGLDAVHDVPSARKFAHWPASPSLPSVGLQYIPVSRIPHSPSPVHVSFSCHVLVLHVWFCGSHVRWPRQSSLELVCGSITHGSPSTPGWPHCVPTHLPFAHCSSAVHGSPSASRAVHEPHVVELVRLQYDASEHCSVSQPDASDT